MRRIQIHVEEDLDDALAAQAAARRVPKAALIREYLAQHVAVGSGGGDAVTRLVGMYEGTSDEHTAVDTVIYGDSGE